jgi:hypothetical protein
LHGRSHMGCPVSFERVLVKSLSFNLK